MLQSLFPLVRHETEPIDVMKECLTFSKGNYVTKFFIWIIFGERKKNEKDMKNKYVTHHPGYRRRVMIYFHSG
jgi:hypothetical protein